MSQGSVIRGAVLRIAERLVGGVQLDHGFRRLRILCQIRMVKPSKGPIGRLDDLRGGGWVDLEDFVGVRHAATHAPA